MLVFFSPAPFIICRPSFFFCCLVVNSHPGSNKAGGSSLPPTHYGSCLAFLSREHFVRRFLNLVNSQRIAPLVNDGFFFSCFFSGVFVPLVFYPPARPCSPYLTRPPPPKKLISLAQLLAVPRFFLYRYFQNLGWIRDISLAYLIHGGVLRR